MGFGGLVIMQRELNQFNRMTDLYRLKFNMRSELKWSKVNTKKYFEYVEFINHFFNASKVNFHSLFLERAKLNHKKFNMGDRELGFYKFYYQILLHGFDNYVADSTYKFIIHPDHRSTPYKLDDLKTVLNNGFKKKRGENYSPYRSIEPVDSKKHNLMQLNDVLLGGLAYRLNGHHLKEGANKGKVMLSEYILDKAGVKNVNQNTPYNASKFTIWHFDLK